MNNMFNMMNGIQNMSDPISILSTLSGFTGKRMSKEDVRKRLDQSFDFMLDSAVNQLVGILYKECSDTTKAKLLDSSDKRVVITKLVSDAFPSFVKKLNDKDVDRIYNSIKNNSKK